jgi:hypothetical protein
MAAHVVSVSSLALIDGFMVKSTTVWGSAQYSHYILSPMPWKARRLSPIEKENHQLRMTVIGLRDELRAKQTALGGLELALQARHQTIDQLNARLEQSRAQCRQLDEECENYFRMLQAG